MLTLHVTNGDSAAQGLARSGLPGDVLAWRDVLHDGPVPQDLGPTAFREVRAAFLSDRHWATYTVALDDLAARDARISALSAADAVVLWFEPDLYDQLQLMQVLFQLASIDIVNRPRISIVPADLMLGPLSPESFRPLYDTRRMITSLDVERGHDAWWAFTSANPDALMSRVDLLDSQIAARRYADDTVERLPHLTSALRRLLEEYPDVESGLSRSERQICDALVSGAKPLSKLYAMAHHESESWVWLGDTSFAWYVERLSQGVSPVIEHTNGTRVVAPVGDAPGNGFWERTVQLTSFGHEVARARRNAIDVNGIDRWIGGVRLTTARHWRWDGHAQRPALWAPHD